MQASFQISFHGVDSSPAVEERIRKNMAKLEKCGRHIIGCHVTVARDHHHHHLGNLFRVQIDLGLAGRELAVTRDHGINHAHEDLHVAIRDAFDAARRRIKRVAQRRREPWERASVL